MIGAAISGTRKAPIVIEVRSWRDGRYQRFGRDQRLETGSRWNLEGEDFQIGLAFQQTSIIRRASF